MVKCVCGYAELIVEIMALNDCDDFMSGVNWRFESLDCSLGMDLEFCKHKYSMRIDEDVV